LTQRAFASKRANQPFRFDTHDRWILNRRDMRRRERRVLSLPHPRRRSGGRGSARRGVPVGQGVERGAGRPGPARRRRDDAEPGRGWSRVEDHPSRFLQICHRSRVVSPYSAALIPSFSGATHERVPSLSAGTRRPHRRAGRSFLPGRRHGPGTEPGARARRAGVRALAGHPAALSAPSRRGRLGIVSASVGRRRSQCRQCRVGLTLDPPARDGRDAEPGHDRFRGSVPRIGIQGKLAEGMRFELTIQFPVYTLSRRAPSTTRPPLRTAGTMVGPLQGRGN
jgi:hypothetical protein